MDNRAKASAQGEVHLADRLLPLSELLDEFVSAANVDSEVLGPQGLVVSEINVELPFELDLLQEAGLWQVDAAPPTQLIETTVMPVWHRIHLRLTADNGVRAFDTLES